MDGQIDRMRHQRAPSSTAAADLTMSMLFIMAVLIVLARMACIALSRILKDLIERNPSLEGARFSEHNARGEAAHAIGSDSPVNTMDRIV
jgi:hypothetical protein